MFDREALSVFARDGGFTMWTYRPATDTVVDLTAAGYFDGAASTMKEGDMILAVVDPRRGQSQLLHVSGIDADGVDVEALARDGLLLPAALV